MHLAGVLNGCTGRVLAFRSSLPGREKVAGTFDVEVTPSYGHAAHRESLCPPDNLFNRLKLVQAITYERNVGMGFFLAY